MGEPIGDAPTAPKAKPTILVPPRGSIFANGSGPGFSPGPTTMVSSLKFPEQGPFSFSQLLAGAMASPLAAAQPQQQLESLSPLFMLNSPGYLSPLQTPFGMSHQQALAHVTAQAALSQSFKQMQAGFHHSSSKHPLEPSTNHKSDTLRQHATSPLSSEPETSKLESIPEKSQSDEKTGDKDGYSWRKYGQKHVKTSEYPRSYYKCTHLNCPVKKKVEKNLDGRVSEIAYKGEHNHDLPNHNKQGKDSCALDTTSMASQGGIETNGSKEDLNVHKESEKFQMTAKTGLEHHSDNSNNCDKEDSAVIVDKANEDEPIAKRRSLDIGPTVPSHQALSEPKIVLRTRSEVDLLDDGYKWRKYGQKVVKGNPYPRSYYRCTYAGCNVRKHVERASADPKAVITTYEGKHNHDVPTGRHISSHGGASSSSQHLKTQKTVPENPSINEETDYGDRDDIPTTLRPKEEQIAV